MLQRSARFRGTTPSPNKFTEIEKLVENHLELVKIFLDDRFTSWLVENVSGYVERTLQPSRLQASEGISTIKAVTVGRGVSVWAQHNTQKERVSPPH